MNKDVDKYYLITWREFKTRKLVSVGEVVKTENIKESIKIMRALNSSKQLTTTDYNFYKLGELLKAKNLELTTIVTEEISNDTE